MEGSEWQVGRVTVRKTKWLDSGGSEWQLGSYWPVDGSEWQVEGSELQVGECMGIGRE